MRSRKDLSGENAGEGREGEVIWLRLGYKIDNHIGIVSGSG